MVIDFRVRPPYKSFLNAVPYKDLVRTEFVCRRMELTLPQAARDGSVQKMVEEMDGAGITRAVIPARRTNPAFGIVDNDDVKELLQRYPDRFLGFMGIDPHDGEAALEEISRRTTQEGFTGVILECGMVTPPLYADDKTVFLIYDFCQERGIPVILLHGANAGPDLSYSAPVAADRVAAAFPKLKLVISHGGWPWVTQMLHVAWRRPNVYISPDMYMVRFPGWQEYVTAANYTLRDRFLFGTAYPFVPFAQGLEYLKNCGILPQRLPDILYHNASRLLELE